MHKVFAACVTLWAVAVFGAEPPPVAVVRSVPGERSSSLSFGSEPVATFAHEPWAVIRGRMLPGTNAALVVADEVKRGDGSFGAMLLRLEPGQSGRVLADRVFHATRPWVMRSGRVFVERGEQGPEPTPEEIRAGALRTDALTVDEVNPSTGEVRTVHAWQGYTAHLCGSFGNELVLYRVRFAYAELVAVDVDSGAVRALAKDLVPFARDFSVDERRAVLVYANYDAVAGDWTVLELGLKTLKQRVLARGTTPALAPFAWPGGKVAWSPRGEDGLALVGHEAWSPLGNGADEVDAVSADGAWIALSHARPSELPVPFVLSQDGATVRRIPAPANTRVEILGFVEVAR